MVTQRIPAALRAPARSNQPLIEITAACDMLTHSPLTAAVLTTPSTRGDAGLIAFAQRSADESGLALTVEPRAATLVLRFRRDGV
ncbi:MAG: hypothetical protein ABI559_07845 [Chloroflexota bacterium]